MPQSQLLDGRFRTGHVLSGRYELRSLLGQGGMAEVYLAWDRLLRRRVAVKVLWEGLARDRRFLVRFRREAHAVASLSHPNIVALFDAGSDAGTPFLVMELVEGETVADAIWEQGPLPVGRALDMGRSVAAALAHAHRSGIIHRDVKAANIMLTNGGGVKVLDFGIARAVAWTPLTVPWGPHGTAEYISPEQIKGEPVDGRSDIYSLGVVLFEALSGVPPFSADGAVAVAYQHLQRRVPRLTALNPGVPIAVEEVVARCLKKDPRDRFQRAEELRNELDRVAGRASGPLSAPSPGLIGVEGSGGDTEEVEPGWTEPRRRRTARRLRAAGIALAVVALIGASVAAAVAWPFRGAPPAKPHASPSAPAPTLPPPLLAPAVIRASDSCDGFLSARIDLTWTPTTSRFADGYEVYRSTSPGGPFQLIALVVGRTKAGYADREVGAGADYYYLVKATGEGRRSLGSARAHARTNGFCV